MNLKQETASVLAKFADKDENTMTKTDWRSEFSDKMASMITPIQQRKMTAMSMQNEIEDFIEQTRIEAQIEVMEELREKQKNISIDSRYNGEMTAIKRAIAVENLTQNSIKALKQK